MFDAFTALSNLNGKSIGNEYSRLATQDVESDEFKKGADYAAICALFSIGKTNETGCPGSKKQKRWPLPWAVEKDQSAVFGCLMQLLFFQPLHEEFVHDQAS